MIAKVESHGCEGSTEWPREGLHGDGGQGLGVGRGPRGVDSSKNDKNHCPQVFVGNFVVSYFSVGTDLGLSTTSPPGLMKMVT